MGIGIRNLSAGGDLEAEATDLAAALRQTAAGLLGTTVQFADLVSGLASCPRPGGRRTDVERVYRSSLS